MRSATPIKKRLRLTFATVAFMLAGCSSTKSPAAKMKSSVGLPPVVQRLEEIFEAMPEPRFRQLTYDYTTRRGRGRTEFTLLTNKAAHAELAFVNYLPHGINPGLMSGYGDLLTITALSSNTLPTIRTIQQITVTKVECVGGKLFPLRVGNALDLNVTREWRQLDPSGTLLDQASSRVTFGFHVIRELQGFTNSSPAVGGKVFVVEQRIGDRQRTETRHLHFAEELGTCVRVVEFAGGVVVEERSLTGWTPLLYRPGSNP